MNLETSRSILRICGILTIAAGVLTVLDGIMSMFLGGAAAQVPEAVADQEMHSGITVLLVSGGSALVTGLIYLIEGYLSYSAGKTGEHAGGAYFFAILGLIGAALNLVSLLFRNIFAWQTIVYGILSLLLSLMLFLAAKKVKESVEQ